VSLSLIGFKLLSGQEICVQGHCDLDLWLSDPQWIGIINGSWPTKTPIMVSLSLIGFKLLSQHRFYV